MKRTLGMEALILVALEVPHWVSIPTRDNCIFFFATVLKMALGPRLLQICLLRRTFSHASVEDPHLTAYNSRLWSFSSLIFPQIIRYRLSTNCTDVTAVSMK
jgi:hypothetical protein